MRTFLLLFFIQAVFALPWSAPAIIGEAAGGISYGVDFAVPASAAQFQCLRQAGYSAAFVRAYNPYGQGGYDPNACVNIHNAYPCLGVEIYMTPQPFSTKNGGQQFVEMVNGLNNNGIKVLSAWIQVVSPANWSPNVQQNINFVNNILQTARGMRIKPNIYTSQLDWQRITGNWAGAGQDVLLWYYNVNGGGPNGETSPTFGDFQPFGSWQFPSVKQFAQTETFCGISPLNRDSFVSTNPQLLANLEGKKADEKPEVYVVGHLGQ